MLETDKQTNKQNSISNAIKTAEERKNNSVKVE